MRPRYVCASIMPRLCPCAHCHHALPPCTAAMHCRHAARLYDPPSISRPRGVISRATAQCIAVRVRSAFGSFGTYYLPLTLDANYTSAALRFARPRGKRGWTEHAPFNMAIAAALGRTRPLLVDPSFRPTYLYASGEYWDYVSGRQPRRIPPAPVRDPREPWTWCPPTTLCEDASRAIGIPTAIQLHDVGDAQAFENGGAERKPLT